MPSPSTIWHPSHLTEAEKRNTQALCDFAGRVGWIIVLSTSSWDWPGLCDVKVRHETRFSRMFPSADFATSPLRGIDPSWLIRWDGFPGTVAFGSPEGAVMDRSAKLLWAREPKTTVVAGVPTASGGGRILFPQLDLQRRVDPTSPTYDPAAERILLELLSGGRMPTKGPGTP